jgi:uncharacterized membrane protein YeiH
MDLMVHQIGLLFWTLLSVAVLAMIVVALLRLARDKRLEPGIRLLCALGIIAFPIIGSLVYLTWARSN